MNNPDSIAAGQAAPQPDAPAQPYTTPDQILLLKADVDGVSAEYLNVQDARGMLDGFLRGGSIIEPVNGGYRIPTPTGHWDLLDPRYVDDPETWKHL